MSEDLYRRAGIEDLAEFYRTKFVSDEVLDARYFRALDRFDMRFARTMWVYGIECTDRSTQKSYEEMTAEELRRFVSVDGHVGLEEEQEHAARFRRFFREVAWESRYTLCLSSEEFVKQADEYGLPFDADFVEYLRGLTFAERRAFDMAMGYVFGKISDLHISLPKSGLYVFLKASDSPLGSFYNEHRDRRALFASAEMETSKDADARPFCLDRTAELD